MIQFNQSGAQLSPADFIWKNRLIIINGEVDCSGWFEEELQKDLSERKLLVFHLKEGSVVESNFKGELKTEDFLKIFPKKEDQGITWVLMGIDGEIKKSGLSLPNSGEVFRIIDSMPMRQSELITKRNQDNSLIE